MATRGFYVDSEEFAETRRLKALVTKIAASDAKQAPKRTWAWTGRRQSQKRFNLTEDEAKMFARTMGGKAFKQ